MLDKEDLIEIYKRMLTVRYFEEKIEYLRNIGEIKSALIFQYGQEAVGIGACYALQKYDYVTSTHRGRAHQIGKGADLKKMMSEIAGRRTGYCKGRAGHHLIAAKEVNLLGGTGVVGGMLPIAVGYGLAFQVKGTSQVVLSFFGDGASNEGVFHESLNLASIWRLPCIFLCENNKYALSVSTNESLNIENIADRAKSYGIIGEIVDGNNPIEVFEKVSSAVVRARKGSGPTLIEAKTYCWAGFSTGDIGGYRTEKEINHYKKHDPILKFEKYLIDSKLSTKTECEKIQEVVLYEIDEAAKFTLDSPYPDSKDL